MVFKHMLSSAVVSSGLLYLLVAAYAYYLEQKVEKNELTSGQITWAKWLISILGVLLLLTLLALVQDGKRNLLNTSAILVSSVLGAILAFYVVNILFQQNAPGAANKLLGIKKFIITSVVIAVIVIGVGLYNMSLDGRRSSGRKSR